MFFVNGIQVFEMIRFGSLIFEIVCKNGVLCTGIVGLSRKTKRENARLTPENVHFGPKNVFFVNGHQGFEFIRTFFIISNVGHENGGLCVGIVRKSRKTKRENATVCFGRFTLGVKMTKFQKIDFLFLHFLGFYHME